MLRSLKNSALLEQTTNRPSWLPMDRISLKLRRCAVRKAPSCLSYITIFKVAVQQLPHLSAFQNCFYLVQIEV